ncbi:CST complex subunit, partial [Nymphaea thermarum]
DGTGILEPLDHPAILIGTVDLWTGVSDRRFGCSKNDCLLFVDEGARVCSDALELDIGMTGRRVTVLAWNLFPSKSSAGLLEIVQWELAEPPPHRWSLGGGSSEHGFYPLVSVQRFSSGRGPLVLGLPPNWSRRDFWERSQYTGAATGTYMQGMVVELDEKVWLVFTDQLENPHSLRVGAIVCISSGATNGSSMAGVKELSVSDLLLLSRPVTGTFSLSVSPSNPSGSSENAVPCPGRTRKHARGDDNQESGLSERSPRILEPLDHPAILIGTVDLWTGVSDRRSGCSKNDCLLFTDEGARVCCDVLELDIGMIGRRVTVLAWNFIPSKCTAGLLEIIKWELAEPPPHRWSSGGGSSEHGFYPLCPSSDSLQSEVRSFSGCRRIVRDEVSGQLTAVSPVFDVPCTAKSELPDVLSESRPDNLNGFLVEFLVCDCSECGSVMYSSHIYGSNVNPVTVYFCGAAAKWRPVFAKLVGSFIHIVGLKRKLVFVDVEPIPMLVSTSKTGMRLYRKEHEVSNEGASTRKRIFVKNEFTGQYTGVVTGVYMQGMVAELDEKVWLVFTDQLENPHSLRVGAIVCISLGLFVGVRNAHFILPKFSWSKILLLGACVKTVLIIKRFSALATRCHVRSRTNSLLAKFVGSLPFIAKFWYIRASSVYISRLLVHRYLNFCLVGFRMLLMVSCFREKFSGILLEKEILGSKSVSPSSGKLQLIDATGRIDAVVPDFRLHTNDQIMYKSLVLLLQVDDFRLIIEGQPFDGLGIEKSNSALCRNIFQHVAMQRRLPLTIYVHFYLKTATYIDSHMQLSASNHDPGISNGHLWGRFHLLFVTHKFPANYNVRSIA